MTALRNSVTDNFAFPACLGFNQILLPLVQGDINDAQMLLKISSGKKFQSLVTNTLTEAIRVSRS